MLSACASTPKTNISNNVIPNFSSNTPSQREVETAITRACYKLGWHCTPVAPGIVTAQLSTETGSVSINISYNSHFYDLHCQQAAVSAEAMLPAAQTEHLLTNLARHISAEFI